MASVDVSGLDKAELLAALFNNSKAQGLGFLQASGRPMTKEEAAKILATNTRMCFDYLQGRVMKIDISGDTIDTWGYDRDNGKGAAEAVVTKLRNGSNVATDKTAEFRKGLDALIATAQPTRLTTNGHIHLGVGDTELIAALIAARDSF